MAGTGAVSLKQVRCPVCLKRLDLPDDSDPNDGYVCNHCYRLFKFKNALPVEKGFWWDAGPWKTVAASEKPDSPVPPADTAPVPRAIPASAMSRWGKFMFLVGLIGVLGAAVAINVPYADNEGWQFDLSFLIAFAAVIIIAWIVRVIWKTSRRCACWHWCSSRPSAPFGLSSTWEGA